MNIVEKEALDFLNTLFDLANPGPELTIAVRKLEECVMWHAKAVKAEPGE